MITMTLAIAVKKTNQVFVKPFISNTENKQKFIDCYYITKGIRRRKQQKKQYYSFTCGEITLTKSNC